MELFDLLLLCLLVLFCLYWQSAQKVKEQALQAALRHCEKMDVQLLDSNVYLRALWLKRDDRGVIRLWRGFMFEFSTAGDRRYRGEVAMLGNKILSVELQPHAVG